ncbi:hypothetical protein BHM03_00004811 [Ensete ventricosum]|nr:hypothetical protein BHM03_00004811 [Ensete ventricosum]
MAWTVHLPESLARTPWLWVTWRSCALRESAESKDRVSGSGRLGVVVQEPGVWRSVVGPGVPEHSPPCGWRPSVSSYCTIEGIYGVTVRLD